MSTNNNLAWRFVPPIALALTLTQGSFAASFDCGKARTFRERTVCSNADLSLLDDKLSQVFKSARSISANPTELVASQRSWLADANKCSDSACLTKAYQTRIEELQGTVVSNTHTAASQIQSPPAVTKPAADASSNEGTGPNKANQSAKVEIDASLVELQGQISAAASEMEGLRSKEVGFKEFKLGKAISSEGVPPGTTKCTHPVDWSPDKNPGVHRETIEAMHARWGAIYDDMSRCSANTTLLEVPVSLEYKTLGKEQIIYFITLHTVRTQLPGISAALSKVLGDPSDKVTQYTTAQLRDEIAKEEEITCEGIKNEFGKESSVLAVTEYQRCRQELPGRVALRLNNVPVAGITETARRWSVGSLVVFYKSYSTVDAVDIMFYSTKLDAAFNSATERFKAEMGAREALAKKAEEASHAKDF